MGSYKVCCFFTRKLRVTETDPPSDVKDAFNKYSDGAIHMTVEQLVKFINECQVGNGGTVSFADAERIVEGVHRKRHPITSLINRKSFTLEDFHQYLFSYELNPPIGSQVHQDMNAPLSHYYIYTGHKSYLTGDQISSSCSEVPIINALKRGVRVVDLDLWPNSTKDNVHVLHGRMLTTPVDLLRCLRAIKEHAFTASPYPVIITLEDHLTPDLQAKVAPMVTETFGDMLFCPNSGKLKELPTLENLKYRILISRIPSKEYLEAKDTTDDDVFGEEPSTVMSYKNQNDKYESDNDHVTEDSKDHVRKSVLCPGYESLIAIRAGKPKGGLDDAFKFEKDKIRHLSLVEQALEKATERHQQDIVRFTQTNILRIYSKGTRFTSSNYKPVIGWLHGAQMIAFNMQGYGKFLWLMHGMFRANGGCGYVKKPDFLLATGPNDEVFDPKEKLAVKLTLKVKIYMGDGLRLDFRRTHFDMYSPDFYTRVAISGAPADGIMRRTRCIEDTWTPVWNEEFTFQLTLPEIALLRVEVHEYDLSVEDNFSGQTCLPVSELRPGIRAVPLCDRKGDPYTAARLLMRFEFVTNMS